MPVFMADRSLPGITPAQLADAQRAAIDTSKKFTAKGKPVEYLRSMYVPEESHCMCLFKAADKATVEEVNKAAGIPYDRIIEAQDLTP